MFGYIDSFQYRSSNPLPSHIFSTETLKYYRLFQLFNHLNKYKFWQIKKLTQSDHSIIGFQLLPKCNNKSDVPILQILSGPYIKFYNPLSKIFVKSHVSYHTYWYISSFKLTGMFPE